ncbi:hypothetical protein NDU88_012973 [Pleurodeles waltl]|uniref:Uncharacterized protein n=1 Tax=Pleurodeles waltl TaxID=8319 RepID=A0AAV7R5E7_PLEWA|nr:hypothetical protein NDU88_012973 [Pleurodeles waltl]
MRVRIRASENPGAKSSRKREFTSRNNKDDGLPTRRCEYAYVRLKHRGLNPPGSASSPRATTKTTDYRPLFEHSNATGSSAILEID